ncbi:hypothetical protein CEQ90_12260 [Lewinellaceae bacterium SD302]|nr:hypothetical protein CEQ90_12260 [Lewinellaceae bacterium SD302]
MRRGFSCFSVSVFLPNLQQPKTIRMNLPPHRLITLLCLTIFTVTRLSAQAKVYSPTTSQPTAAEMAIVNEMISPDQAATAVIVDLDYDDLLLDLLQGDDVTINVDGNSIDFEDYTQFNSARRIFIDEGNTHYMYTVPGKWFVNLNTISNNQINIVGDHIYVSPTVMYARITQGNVKHIFTPFEGDANKVGLLYSQIIFNGSSGCVNVNNYDDCNDVAERIAPGNTLPSIPERELSIAFELDYETVTGSTGANLGLRMETSVAKLDATLFLHNNTFLYYFNMQLRSDGQSACTPGFPNTVAAICTEYSNFGGISYVLNTNPDDGFDYSGGYSGNGPQTLAGEVISVYAQHDFRQCIQTNLVQFLRGKDTGFDKGIVVTTDQHRLKTNPTVPSWQDYFCNNILDALTRTGRQGFVSIIDLREKADPGETAGTSFHEICHNLGLRHTGETNSACVPNDCCSSNTEYSYVMCDSETGSGDPDRDDLFRLAVYEQLEVLNLLDLRGSCLEIPSSDLTYCFDNCKLTVEENFTIANAPVIGCEPAPIGTYSFELCNNCEARTITNFGMLYFPNFLSPVEPLNDDYYINTNGVPGAGSAHIYQSQAPLSLTAGECINLTFDFELTSYTIGQAVPDVRFVLSTDFAGESRFFTPLDISHEFEPPIAISGGTVTAPILLSSLTDGNSPIIPPNESSDLVIETAGVLAIDEDHTFINATIILDTDASIVVKSGSKLTLTNSHLLGCGALWKSIIVETGGTLEIDGSTISNADEAILLEDGAIASITGNHFVDNRIALFMPGTSGGTLETDLNFNDNRVEQVAPSFYSLSATCGVLAEDQLMVSILGTPGQENVFENLQFGIIAINSYTDCRQNYFRHIRQSAIRSLGEEDAVVSPFLFASGTFGAEPAIKDCQFGIDARGNVGTWVLFQIIENCKVGVSINTNRNAVVRFNNLSNIHRVGISVGNPDSKPGLLFIEQNAVELDDVTNTSLPNTFGMAGIRIVSNDASNRNVRVKENTINNRNYNGRGISLVNVLEADILDNTVTIGGDANQTGVGIEVTGGNGNLISCNDVSGLDPAATSNLWLENVGIRATASNNVEVRCNNIDQVSIGAEFRNVSLGADVATNEFNQHYYGLKIGHDEDGAPEFVSIGSQNHTGNTWQNGAGGFQAVLNNPTLSDIAFNTFFVDVADCSNLLPTAVNTTQVWFNPQGGNTESCYVDNSIPTCASNDPLVDCAGDDQGNGPDRPGETERLLMSNRSEPSISMGSLLAAHKQLYENILSGAYQTSDSLTQFAASFDSLKTGAAAYWSAILRQPTTMTDTIVFESYLSDWSLDSLAAISPATLRQTLVNNGNNLATALDQVGWATDLSVYASQAIQAFDSKQGPSLTIDFARQIVSPFTWSTTELSAITNSASTCLSIAGPESFAARSTFWQLYPDSLLTLGCSGSSEFVSSNSETAFKRSDLRVFPNPVRSILNIQVSEIQAATALLKIYNGQGVTVASRNLVGNSPSQRATINVSTWPPGLYYLVLEQGESTTHRKIVVQ